MGLDVGILLLSRIRAELYIIFYLLPVNGRHLWFMTYPDIGQYSQLSILVAWSQKHRVDVGISLLSCVRAEIHLISYLLPVNGRHLWFTTYPFIEQHHYFQLLILWHWKRVIAVEIVLLSCVFAEIRVITLFQPPSWISDFRFHLELLLVAPLTSSTPKT